MTYDPKEARDSRGRWGRMGSQAKAKLTASAQFVTKAKPGKSGKLGTIGSNSPRMIATPFKPSEPSAHAVQITTAKALDRDFHNAREKQDHAEMAAAIARHQGLITKYPSTKPKR